MYMWPIKKNLICSRFRLNLIRIDPMICVLLTLRGHKRGYKKNQIRLTRALCLLLCLYVLVFLCICDLCDSCYASLCGRATGCGMSSNVDTGRVLMVDRLERGSPLT